MSVTISGVQPGSPASRHAIRTGDLLEQINGHAIHDVLDYRFYMIDRQLQLDLRRGEECFAVSLHKGEYEDLGLLFDTYLMDKQRPCRNRCVFCFIDQLPPGLRDSLYFKDDDSRMSFLFGNYITLTNLQEWDVERIVRMHISPVNVSVHTTNPALRATMMGNRNAGRVLDYLPRLAEAGIRINAQLVLCPGFNDGTELERSLTDLSRLLPSLQSVAAVPVGLTRYRRDLPPLRLFTRKEAAAVLDTLHAFGEQALESHGSRTFFGSDEFYLLAGRELPDHRFYEDFYQLENGVGMLRLLLHEFGLALESEEPRPVRRRITLATGVDAAPFLRQLADRAMRTFAPLDIQVHSISNRFFGETITVSGLVTGGDIAQQLAGLELGEELLLPSAMLRHEGDLFLDGVSLEDLSQRLGVPVRVVDSDGFALLDALLGQLPAV